MAYEELSEPWYPPKAGDWVTDKKGDVWQVQNKVKELQNSKPLSD